MNYKNGSMYLIDYGFTSKTSTFLHAEDGQNLFFDIDGKFILTDKFIKNNNIIITELAE